MYKRARLGMGYLPQEESIFRKMTVEQNILAILETLPLSKAARRKIAANNCFINSESSGSRKTRR